MGKRKDIVGESWEIEADMATVQKKWAEFTTALKYEPWPSANRSGEWLTWFRPETEGEDEGIVFEEIRPGITRVQVIIEYDENELREDGATFADAARGVDQDMALFKDYVEGRLPKDWPASSAS